MFTRRRFIVLTGSAALGTQLAGCTTSDEDRVRGADPAATSPGVSSASEPGAYPVTITHKFGTTTIDRPPARVVTAGLKEQDDCLALGVVPVASTTWFDLGGSKIIGPWAKEALGDRPEPAVLTWTDRLEFEKIAAAAPDLILASYAGLAQADYDKLSALAPTVAQPKEYGDYGVPWDVQAATVGKALGRPGAMAELIARAKQVVVDAATATPPLPARPPSLRPRTRGFSSTAPRTRARGCLPISGSCCPRT